MDSNYYNPLETYYEMRNLGLNISDNKKLGFVTLMMRR